MSVADRASNRTKGILWMLATMLCFVSLDSIMKLGLEFLPLLQVTWGRFFFATAFTAVYCGRNLPQLSRSNHPKLQFARSALLMVTTGLFNAGIMHLPLVTASTIMFLSPIIVTVLSVFILAERVVLRQWLGVIIGFLGAVIVVEPWHAGEDTFNVGVFFFLAAALTNAFYQIVTRAVRDDAPLTSLLFTAATGALVTTLFLPPVWVWPNLYGWLLLAGSGFAGALGHLCLIRSFQLAPASVAAPYSYSSLLWASAFGLIIWGDVPQINVILGAALIVAAGMFIFVSGLTGRARS